MSGIGIITPEQKAKLFKLSERGMDRFAKNLDDIVAEARQLPTIGLHGEFQYYRNSGLELVDAFVLALDGIVNADEDLRLSKHERGLVYGEIDRLPG